MAHVASPAQSDWALITIVILAAQVVSGVLLSCHACVLPWASCWFHFTLAWRVMGKMTMWLQ